jgi:hypothetical protein
MTSSSGHSDTKPKPSWLDLYPQENRGALAQLGIPPDSHTRAAEYNRRVVKLLGRGLQVDALFEAVSRLHVAVFGMPVNRAPIAGYLRELVAVNRAGGIDYLGRALVGADGAISFTGSGTCDPVYAMRAIEAVADILDGVSSRDEFARRVAELPPRSPESDDSVRRRRAGIRKALRSLATKNDRGKVAGVVVVVCGPAGAAYRIIGTVPPRPTARALSRSCDVIARESGRARPSRPTLAGFFDAGKA